MSTTDLASPDKKDIREFFNSIAERYDALNTLLSFRMDEAWRRKSRDLLLEGRPQSILDIGVGTGKFLEMFLKAQSWQRAAGLDFSEEMLVHARKHVGESVELVSGDFHDLPFENGSFDRVVSSFTLRSVKDMDLFLAQIHRVLRPGGKVGLLCLTRPKNAFVRGLYYPYLKYYLPWMGNLLSGSSKAYCFLSESIQKFSAPEATVEKMCGAGFRNMTLKSFAFGASTLIMGEK